MKDFGQSTFKGTLSKVLHERQSRSAKETPSEEQLSAEPAEELSVVI
jgi:hypothetical protein